MPIYGYCDKIADGEPFPITHFSMSASSDISYRLNAGPILGGPPNLDISSIHISLPIGPHTTDVMSHIFQQGSGVPATFEELKIVCLKNETMYMKFEFKGFSAENHNVMYNPGSHGESFSAQFKELHWTVQALDEEDKPVGGPVTRAFNVQTGKEI